MDENMTDVMKEEEVLTEEVEEEVVSDEVQEEGREEAPAEEDNKSVPLDTFLSAKKRAKEAEKRIRVRGEVLL